MAQTSRVDAIDASPALGRINITLAAAAATAAITLSAFVATRGEQCETHEQERAGASHFQQQG